MGRRDRRRAITAPSPPSTAVSEAAEPLVAAEVPPARPVSEPDNHADPALSDAGDDTPSAEQLRDLVRQATATLAEADQVLAAAHDEADQVVAAARAEADQVRAAAHDEAARLQPTVEVEATVRELVTDAQARGQELLAEAEATAQSWLEEAEAEATRTLELAEACAGKLESAADARAAEVVARATAEADELRARARDEAMFTVPEPDPHDWVVAEAKANLAPTPELAPPGFFHRLLHRGRYYPGV